MITDNQMHEATDRIARSADGQMLYLFLQRKLMGVAVNAEDSALRSLEGQRILAASLMGLMAKGIVESGGHSEPICTFAVAGPRAVASASRGAGRRITDNTFIPGYDDASGGTVPDASAKPGS